MVPQALVCAISGENTKSSVLQWENTHFLPARHSILESISQLCGAKLHCEPPSQLILRSLARAMPSPKPFKNMDREHQVGPWPHSMQPSVKIWWFQFKLVNTNLSIIYYLRSPQLGSPMSRQNTANTHFPCKIGGYPEDTL